MQSGQHIAVSGTVYGYYLFRRCQENKSESIDRQGCRSGYAYAITRRSPLPGRTPSPGLSAGQALLVLGNTIEVAGTRIGFLGAPTGRRRELSAVRASSSAPRS
jgi:hypothetical protein